MLCVIWFSVNSLHTYTPFVDHRFQFSDINNKKMSHDPSSETVNPKDHCMTQEESQNQKEDSHENNSGFSQNKLP